MRRNLLFAALALALPVVATTAADALPTVSVNQPPPVSVNRLPTASQPERQPSQQAARRRALVRKWRGVAQCESGGNWRANTGNGYYGGLQFSLQTWQAYGGEGRPDRRPAWYQSKIAERVRRQSGLHHWPNCGHHYRG